jgi:hypothetical protein
MPKYRPGRERKGKCHEETKCITEETLGRGKRGEEARRGRVKRGNDHIWRYIYLKAL